MSMATDEMDNDQSLNGDGRRMEQKQTTSRNGNRGFYLRTRAKPLRVQCSRPSPQEPPICSKKEQYLHYSPKSTRNQPTSHILSPHRPMADPLSGRLVSNAVDSSKALPHAAKRQPSKQVLLFQPYGIVSKERFPPARTKPNRPASVSSQSESHCHHLHAQLLQ